MGIPNRRRFMRSSAAVTAGFLGLQAASKNGVAAEEAAATTENSNEPKVGYGELLSDPKGILDLPRGFSYSIISKVGGEMDDGLFIPGAPDGMAANRSDVSNIEAIGALLYGPYIVLFEIAGIILLVAMIGAIVLTHREPKPGARGRQDIGKQIARRPDEATVMKNPEIGQGIEL